MKITIKRDHPLTLVGLILVGYLLSRMEESMDGVDRLDGIIMLILLLFLVAARLIEIRQTIVLEEGKLTLIGKRTRDELILSRIVSVSKKGRKLTVFHQAGEMEVDVAYLSKKNLSAVLSHIAKDPARAQDD